MTLRMDGSTGIDTSAINGAALRLETKSDLENQKLGMDLTAVYGGMDFLGMNLYFGGRELMFASPELIDPVLYLDLGEGWLTAWRRPRPSGRCLRNRGRMPKKLPHRWINFSTRRNRCPRTRWILLL